MTDRPIPGVVVVTHGQLATELLNAAETIGNVIIAVDGALAEVKPLLRDRATLGATDIRIFADVDVKHSAPLAPRPLADKHGHIGVHRQKQAGRLRDDVPSAVLQTYLDLVLDGLVARLASGDDPEKLSAVLDLVEASVRRPAEP